MTAPGWLASSGADAMVCGATASGRGRGSGNHGGGGGAHDANAAVLLGDLDLGEAGLVQHRGERADRVGIERDAGHALASNRRSAMAVSASA